MKPTFALVPLALALAIAAAGCGSKSSTSSSYSTPAAAAPTAAAPAPTAATTVATGRTKLGTVLVDGQGRTLYLFEKDKGPQSTCSGSCASVWPPLKADGKLVSTGAAVAKNLKASNGIVTYAGHPLYTYAGDTKAGDVKGQDLDQFGAEWYVLAPSGRKID
jgi:predicted lipoprotein with Yx(FWY)xxD motif